MKKYVMKSAFAPDMERFVIHKRALGYKYKSEADILASFDRYCVANNISENLLSQKLLEGWGTKREGEHQKSHGNRVVVLRQLALFIEKEGRDAYVLSQPITSSPCAFVPHIFTRSEMEAIFHAADTIRDSGAYSPFMNHILPVLFRIMYCCGLRVSEACNLKKQHVDIPSGILTVIDSKDNKDRLVPMSPNVACGIHAYLNKMSFICPKTEYIFPNRSGDKVSKVTIYARFRMVLFEAGIPHRGRGKGPRLHDLRHTMAVHSLEKMAGDGMDLYCALPILSAYLGHSDIRSTEKYLRLTPESYNNVLNQLIAAYGNIAPVVGEGATQ